MKCWVVASRIRSMKSSRNWAQTFKWVVSSSRTKSPGVFFFFGWGFYPTFLSLPSKRTVLKLQTPDFLVYVIMLAEWNHGRRRKCSVLKMKRGRTSFLMSSGLCFKVRCDSDSIQFLFFFIVMVVVWDRSQTPNYVHFMVFDLKYPHISSQGCYSRTERESRGNSMIINRLVNAMHGAFRSCFFRPPCPLRSWTWRRSSCVSLCASWWRKRSSPWRVSNSSTSM